MKGKCITNAVTLRRPWCLVIFIKYDYKKGLYNHNLKNTHFSSIIPFLRKITTPFCRFLELYLCFSPIVPFNRVVIFCFNISMLPSYSLSVIRNKTWRNSSNMTGIPWSCIKKAWHDKGLSCLFPIVLTFKCTWKNF